MKIDFEITKKGNYKPEFGDMISEGDRAIKIGKTRSITLDDVWKSSQP